VTASKTPLSRRLLLAAVAAGAAGMAAAHVMPAAAQWRQQGPAEVPVEELMRKEKDGLSDLALGPADAKVTVIEYASATCSHCADFSKRVWPALKTKYVDSGKIHYILREFPRGDLDAAAFMLARCAGDKAFPLLEVLFEKQEEWAFGEGNRVPQLFEIAKQAGFTQESFDKCLTDQKLLDQLMAQRTRATDVFGVSATPTFYINGKRLDGEPTMEKFDQMIEPLLSGKS
jgi:protein-disulfide isomerase